MSSLISPHTERNRASIPSELSKGYHISRDLLGMVENSFDGMCVADGEGTILLVNPALEKVTGLKKSEIIGRKAQKIVYDKLISDSAITEAIKTGNRSTVLVESRAKKIFISSAVPIRNREGKIVRIYCNLRDVTELLCLKEKYKMAQKSISKYLFELQEVKKRQTIQYNLVTRNKLMKEIVETAYRIAPVDCTVLLLGESGVGKDLLARIIHEASPRKGKGTFVKVNCGAIPEQLLESELFGYLGGAFTDAKKEGKIGYFDVAHEGTILLDEIGDLPLRLQGKLLSVIQEHKFVRVGGVRTKEVDVRIIAATNKDLSREVKLGNFRNDLYFRLNVIPIRIPPLRDRKDDIPFLLTHYLEKFNEKYKTNKVLVTEVVDLLAQYKWPGNVRELGNLVERLIVALPETTIGIEHIPKEYVRQSLTEPNETEIESTNLKRAMEDCELRLIKSVLEGCKTQEEAAYKLGISLSSLSRRIRKIKTSHL
jgi:PAS domain S-box-containing protein